jgi:hypothetical protein
LFAAFTREIPQVVVVMVVGRIEKEEECWIREETARFTLYSEQ